MCARSSGSGSTPRPCLVGSQDPRRFPVPAPRSTTVRPGPSPVCATNAIRCHPADTRPASFVDVAAFAKRRQRRGECLSLGVNAIRSNTRRGCARGEQRSQTLPPSPDLDLVPVLPPADFPLPFAVADDVRAMLGEGARHVFGDACGPQESTADPGKAEADDVAAPSHGHPGESFSGSASSPSPSGVPRVDRDPAPERDVADYLIARHRRWQHFRPHDARR